MRNNEVNNPQLLTLRQASDMLNCHPNTLRSWDKEGYLVAIRIGKRGDRRFKLEDIRMIMKKRKI